MEYEQEQQPLKDYSWKQMKENKEQLEQQQLLPHNWEDNVVILMTIKNQLWNE